jgi:hypothetical protein
MIPLKFLRLVNLNRIGHIGSIVAIAGLLTYNHYLRVRATEVRYVYSNPKTVEKIVVNRVEGPVRIVTVIKETPTGEKETTIREERAQIVETTGELKTSEPVPIVKTIGDSRRNRWLAGVGLLDLSSERRPMALGGLSFGNKLDLIYGGRLDRGRLEHAAFFVARF